MPKQISERNRLFTLISVIIICVVLSVFCAIGLLYQAAFYDYEHQFKLSVHSQKELIAAVGRFDAKNSQTDHAAGALGGTLSQVVDAHNHYSIEEKTAEFFFVELRGDEFIPIMLHNFAGVLSTHRYQLGGKELVSPKWFESMQEVLKKNTEGRYIYDGMMAVYASLSISGRQFYLINKISMSEIRGPFINAALITFFVALFLIIAGAWVISRQVNPLIRQLKSQVDITRDTMARTAAIINTVRDGIFTLDKNGVMKSINPAVEEMFGYVSKELQEKSINMLLPMLGRSEHEKNISDYISTEKSHIINKMLEIEGRHKSGCTFPMEFSVNDFYIGDERYFTCVVRDITVRKKSEAELKQHRDNLEEMVAIATTEVKAIVQTAVSAVISINQYGIVHIFNPAAEKMFGWKSEEIVGKNISIIVPGVGSAAHNKYIQRYLETNDPHIVGIGREVEALRKDGSLFPANLAVGHCQLSEDDHLFVAFISDISDQKRSEKELLDAKNRAEEAARVKASFLANMSHEIRTPMNAIIGFSEILLQDSSLQESSRQHTNTILSSGRNLLNIINDILDFSKIEAGRINLENVCFHLSNIMQDILRTLEFKAAEKNLSLNLHISPEVPVRVMGDPTRLRQVIINLVGNAIKFTPSGSVSIEVAKAKDESLIQFSITDTGIGMLPSQSDKVFDAFAQADSSTNRRFGGTGLGTTISKQIVELMGGQIWVESRKGEGSTFYFTVHMNEGKEYEHCLFEDSTLVQADFQSPRGFKVLLAEDIQANATLAIMRLEQQGHRVTWVENGQLAINAVLVDDYDVVLMDIQMPELDGLEATRQIRQKMGHSKKHLPIIALTASIMSEERQECRDAGMDGVVGKPIDFSELLSTMEVLVPEGRGITNDITFSSLHSSDSEINFALLESFVDVEQGLNAWQEPLVYAKALKSFSDERRHNAIDIRRALEESRETAQVIVHALKGLAGNLFITRVVRAATLLDVLLKTEVEGDIEATIIELDNALQQVTQAIDQIEIPQEEDQSNDPLLDPELAQEAINQFVIALDELNPDVAEPYLKQLRKFFNKEDLVSIQHSINNFDFERAKEEADKLAQHFNLCDA